MAPNKGPDDPYHHKFHCGGKHRKGHWCWTDAEIKSLKHQAGVLHLEWPSIAKSFKIDGFVRHDALQCFKKWTEYRDSTAQTPIRSTTLQENTPA
ncbi:hypothetical protein INS49_003274 [Diaporthe citri]|uniref:uncharacterized protein n=1 Tax=Diaporthe citri TaxID=83186 RepID=UPI001C81198B|nr:uncharacterized protein INS49_003274 [Diaporthe citri]KAG6355313.1 hypothetical protein INS49_003274 [Diaporthe citri]